MSAENLGKQNIRTAANDDVKAQIAGSTSANLLDVDSSGRITAKIEDASGSAFAAGNPLPISVIVGGAAKGATGSPFFVELNQGAAALSATNGLFTNVLQGNAVLSATHGLFTNVLNGDAVLSATNTLATRLSDGSAFNAQANPVYAAVSKNTSANAVANPIFVELSDGTAALGTSGNPLYTTTTGSTGTAVRSYLKGAAVSSGADSDHDYTVTSGKTLTLRQVTVSCPDGGHFEVILDAAGTPSSLDTFYLSPGQTAFVKEFTSLPTLAATLVLRIRRTNDSHRSAPMASSFYGTEA